MAFRAIAHFGLALALTFAPAFGRNAKTAKPKEMTADKKSAHVLNRLAFGPRPGDLEKLENKGIKKWVNEQLHPNTIAESPALTAKLRQLDTLGMSAREMADKYPPNQLIRQMVQGKVPWPDDPETRRIAERLAKRYREKLSLPGEAEKSTGSEGVDAFTPEQRQNWRAGTAEQKVKLLQSLSTDQQFEVITALGQGQRKLLFAEADAKLRRQIQRYSGTQQLVAQDLVDAKIYRAAYSNRQLQEVLTDFWYNHFNVFLDKGADRYEVTSYERDVIRPHVLGKFKDLLLATAESPAMLFYLDNYQSVGPDSPGVGRNPNAKRAKRGLNENYGRELMELHTLGVDGGYTQKDVTEVARCFTGWTIRQPLKGGGFEFNARQHDKGEKRVLGVTIAAGGGIEDGYKVIDILTRHPSTARFISRSLAIRFVSDNPPQSLVDRMAKTFLRKDGDLREVMKTMLNSREFWSEDAYRAKIKSPFEMVISSLRATGAEIDYTVALAKHLTELGEPLYRKQEPSGYSNKSAEWMNSAALLGRMNFALSLTANKVAGVKVNPETPVAGLSLGSPDFQRR